MHKFESGTHVKLNTYVQNNSYSCTPRYCYLDWQAVISKLNLTVNNRFFWISMNKIIIDKVEDICSTLCGRDTRKNVVND